VSIVLEDAESCPGDVGEGFELRPLVLERPEATFHNGIVIAATCTTHRAGQVESFQSLLVVVAGVLRASITASLDHCDAAGRSCQIAATQRCYEEPNRPVVCEAFSDRSALDLPTEQVQYNSQINPVGSRRQVRDVCYPLFVWGVCFE